MVKRNKISDAEQADRLHRLIDTAAGRKLADIVLKNARFVNVFTNRLETADIAVCDGVIAGIGSYEGVRELDMAGKVLCPGFMDAHIHLESSLVAPAEFARAVIPHGTTAVVTDPHEIANVMGTKGIDYMLQATCGLPLDVWFMLPSCVPATPVDESGAVLTHEDIEKYYDDPRVLGLAEMMDFVGVTFSDSECLAKINAAVDHGAKVDGHGPGLAGKILNAYVAAGIESDHECSTLEEALEKISRGQMIMIREGTAARNLDALIPLLTSEYGERCMFCSDDKHPSDLLELGHMDYVMRRAVKAGADPIIAVKAATYNTARYFGLRGIGAIAPGCKADMVAVDDLENFRVEQVWKNGAVVFDGAGLIPIKAPAIDPSLDAAAHATFSSMHFDASDFASKKPLAVIGTVAGEITTTNQGKARGIDVAGDVLKIAVIERHRGTGHIGLGYIKGYGLKSGAVATSFAHDSHNMIVIGTSEEEMASAVKRLAANEGGIVVTESGKPVAEVILSIAGLMSDAPLSEVNDALEKAKAQARAMGVSSEIDPFMTLSFLSLPVIPELRITTKGVFDVSEQKYI